MIPDYLHKIIQFGEKLVVFVIFLWKDSRQFLMEYQGVEEGIICANGEIVGKKLNRFLTQVDELGINPTGNQ